MSKRTFKLSNIGRLAFRAPAALLWTSVLHETTIRIPNLIQGRRPRLHIINLWGKGFAWIMGIRVHERNQREGEMGDVIIANHMGFLDIPVLLSYYPAVFIIKMEMRKVPYFGRALEEHGHVFVKRGDKGSAREATRGLVETLEAGGRVIVFPEGGASPGATRRPFKPRSFIEAQRLGKRVEVCVLDYLPNRKELQWDTSKKMIPQMIELFGRRRSDVSVEFFPPEFVEGDPDEYAQKWHDIIEGRLRSYEQDTV